MTRFRLLVIVAAVWVTLIFSLGRPDLNIFGLKGVPLDAVTYIVTGISALATLWLPDLARRTELVFLPALAVYLLLRLTLSNALPNEDLLLLVLEIAVIYLTVMLFRRISLALLSFEQTVDRMLLRPDKLRVLPMDVGTERIKEEITRARRFNRQVGLLLLSAQTNDLENTYYRFDLEGALQKHYRQLRMAQIAELVLYNVDLVVLYGDQVLICLPETTPDIVMRKMDELRQEIEWRMSITPAIGFALFPEDGFIFRALVDRAAVRMYEEQDRLAAQADDDGPASSANNQQKTARFSALRLLTSVFAPWPNIIEQEQRAERLGWGAGHTEGDLYDPQSWVAVLPYQTEGSRRLYLLLKHAIDLLLVVIALPLVAPAMLVIPLFIWLEDGGEIFFRQERTGYGGQRFNMIKFRTMVPNAEQRLQDLAAQGGVLLDANGKLIAPLKLADDPRVTRTGRVLRRTSLDELPQILNVLRGDMSIVGPRPTSWDTSNYRLFQTERLQVRPGITGLWQVTARGSTDFNEWVDWDRTYVEKICLSLDAQIFVRTVLGILRGRGAR